MRLNRIRFVGTTEYRDDASSLLTRAGDVALVKRAGRSRLILLLCPDGCGQQVVLNLDSRAGPAWHCYVSDGRLSVVPSVSLDSGCKSHFVIWDNRVWWARSKPSRLLGDEGLARKIFRVLEEGPLSYMELAETVKADPVRIVRVASDLVEKGELSEEKGLLTKPNA